MFEFEKYALLAVKSPKRSLSSGEAQDGILMNASPNAEETDNPPNLL
jgi:hypothetical protein